MLLNYGEFLVVCAFFGETMIKYYLLSMQIFSLRLASMMGKKN